VRPRMVSAANLKAIRQAHYDYIVGMKMRGLLEVREQVPETCGRYREVKHNLWVKEVWVGPRRYVVCMNPERAEKDRKDRQAIRTSSSEAGLGGVKKINLQPRLSAISKSHQGAASLTRRG